MMNYEFWFRLVCLFHLFFWDFVNTIKSEDRRKRKCTHLPAGVENRDRFDEDADVGN